MAPGHRCLSTLCAAPEGLRGAEGMAWECELGLGLSKQSQRVRPIGHGPDLPQTAPQPPSTSSRKAVAARPATAAAARRCPAGIR
jgi:hypothetical protein